MTTDTEQYTRWEPIPSLPECPFGDIRVTYDSSQLSVVASYAFDPLARKFLINFGRVEAFKAYDELSDPWMVDGPSQPLVRNNEINAWVWPLQQVVNSRWTARVVARNGGLEGFAWRHFCMVTTDKSLHVMSLGQFEKVELIL